VTTSARTSRVALADLQVYAHAEWRAALLASLRSDARLLTLFGRREGDAVTLTAALMNRESTLEVSRTTVPASHGYHELTSVLPALHCFERELAEQTGLHVADHPWLKPVRYEGREQSAMSSHPYYEMEGKELHEVAVGPIHAGVIEPGSFRFICHGEQVLHLEVQLGYQHRGVERRLLEREPRSLAPLVETIAGDSSVAHAWAYCAAVESLAGCELKLEVDLCRAVALELERVAMHLATLSGLCADIGLLQGATTYGRLRTIAINTTMRLCGSRFGRTALRPGAARLRCSPELAREARANVQLLQRDLEPVNDLVLSSRTVQHRLRGVGVVSAAQATELGLVGPVARASGLSLDLRALARAGAFQLLPIDPVVLPDGDCWSRARVRIAELVASLAWLAAAFECYPSPEPPPRPVGALAPNQLALALVEGVRGEVVHCLETGPDGELRQYKVQDPSFRNWQGLALALRGNEISDFPICNKSFDLSYCGSDL
jgi:Ni,Fe-hydrogenase III large subunit